MYKFAIAGVIAVVFGLAPLSYAAESADSVLKEAKSYFKKADKLQGGWVTTKKLMKKAQAAIKKGNEKQALKLAKKARFEAKQSLAQAQQQLKNWSEPAYIKK